MWPVIITLSLIAVLLVFTLFEAIHDLDDWVANRERREREGYDYENDRYIVKKPTPEPVKKPTPVNFTTANVDNFPKTPEEAKKKVEELLKKVQKKA